MFVFVLTVLLMGDQRLRCKASRGSWTSVRLTLPLEIRRSHHLFFLGLRLSEITSRRQDTVLYLN
jgi:hypothetical protein